MANNPSTPPQQKAIAEKALVTSLVFQVIPESGGSERGRQALRAAVQELEAGAREIGGANRGPFVEKYQRESKLPQGSPWSVAFVTWCYSKVAGGLPFEPTGYGPSLLEQFRNKGWLHSSKNYEPKPGDVVWKKTADGRGTRLLGIVQSYENATLYVIQGNVGEDKVAARAYLSSASFIFGHVP